MANSVEFVIDVSTRLPDGEAAVDTLDALAQKLAAGGAASDAFDRATARTVQQLENAKRAAASAAGALKTSNAEYSTLEREANRAARALERAELRGAVPDSIRANAANTKAALQSYAQTLRMVESRSEAATAEQLRLERQLKNIGRISQATRARAAALNQRFSDGLSAVSALPGPLGSVGSQMSTLGMGARSATSAMGGMSAGAMVTAAAVAGIAVAAVAAAAAVAALTAKFIEGATAAADYERDLRNVREAYAGIHPRAAAAIGQFDELNKSTGLTDDRLLDLTNQLRAFEVPASQMPRALKAIALAEAALGKGGASEFVAKLKDGRMSLGQLERMANRTFKGVVEKRLLSLSAQTDTLQFLWSKLFAGVNVTPLLKGLDRLVQMFDRAHPLGRMLAGVFETLFGPIARNAEAASFAVERFVLEFQKTLLQLFLFAKPVIDKIADALGFKDTTLGDTLKVVGMIAKVAAVAVVGLGIAFGVLATAGAALAAFLASIVVGPLVALGAAVTAVGTFAVAAGRTLLDLGKQAVEWGRNIIDGLVDGLVSGLSKVTDFFGQLGQTIAGSVTDLFSDTPLAGLFGLDSGEVVAAAANTSAERTRPTAEGVQSVVNSRSSGPQFNLTGAQFSFANGDQIPDAAEQLRDAFTALLEEDSSALAGAAQ